MHVLIVLPMNQNDQRSQIKRHVNAADILKVMTAYTYTSVAHLSRARHDMGPNLLNIPAPIEINGPILSLPPRRMYFMTFLFMAFSERLRFFSSQICILIAE